jgi:hypothetical protein
MSPGVSSLPPKATWLKTCPTQRAPTVLVVKAVVY